MAIWATLIIVALAVHNSWNTERGPYEAALLHHYVGLSKAKEIILTGDLYPVTEFAAQGLINRMAAPGQLRVATLELLGSVTASTREVIATQKGLFETWLDHGLRRSIDTSTDVFADVFRAPDSQRELVTGGRRTEICLTSPTCLVIPAAPSSIRSCR